MLRTSLCVAALLATSPALAADDLPNSVRLDGEKVKVYWSDGDSFTIRSGRHKGGKARLMGYNTLESYGPVHSWGDWTGDELYVLHKRGTRFARSRVWDCKFSGDRDTYKRMLIRCDDLVVGMISEGYGHLFGMPGSTVDPKELALQKKAMAEKKGMWAKGVPKGIITSLHSVDERDDGGTTYNRIADPQTGLTRKHEHKERYEPCQKVCIDGSCMVYAPFDKRYGKRRLKCLWVAKEAWELGKKIERGEAK